MSLAMTLGQTKDRLILQFIILIVNCLSLGLWDVGAKIADHRMSLNLFRAVFETWPLSTINGCFKVIACWWKAYH
jgi:hypothetical protein